MPNMHLLAIHDNGTNKIVSGTHMEPEQKPYDFSQYDQVNQDVYEYVNKKIITNRIEYPNNLEAAPQISDLVLTWFEPADKAKEKAQSELLGFAGNRISFVLLYKFYGYFNLHMKFSDAGIYITDANREEKYLEIINTGNAELINDLERYLSFRDELSEDEFFVTNLFQTLDNIGEIAQRDYTEWGTDGTSYIKLVDSTAAIPLTEDDNDQFMYSNALEIDQVVLDFKSSFIG